MLFWFALLVGVFALIALIVIQEWNRGYTDVIAPILTGVFLAIGVMSAIRGLYLAAVLCFLPLIVLTVLEVIMEADYV